MSDNLLDINAALLSRLGEITDAGALGEFNVRLNADDEFERALGVKISRWLEKAHVAGPNFDAGQFCLQI